VRSPSLPALSPRQTAIIDAIRVHAPLNRVQAHRLSGLAWNDSHWYQTWRSLEQRGLVEPEPGSATTFGVRPVHRFRLTDEGWRAAPPPRASDAAERATLAELVRVDEQRDQLLELRRELQARLDEYAAQRRP
jgi:DNA-binding PadR family transcriptional regulator